MGELFGYLILTAFLGYVLYALVQVAKDVRERFRIRATRLRQKSFDKERAKQLSDLKASVPSTPPDRMRATIRVNSFTAFTTISARRGEQDLETTHYAVDMILELSERDRATILEHHLDQIMMEKVPAYPCHLSVYQDTPEWREGEA